MAKVKLGNVKGSKGDKGDRGSLWRVTDKMTGQSTSDTAFPGAEIAESVAGDMCLNPITCDIYKCTAGGDAANAKWVWVMNNRGPQGPKGDKGDPTTVDAVLSKDSVNPIQNKAVATKFQDVQDSLSQILPVVCGGDLNERKSTCIVRCYSSTGNMPVASWGICLVLRAGDYISQLYINNYDTSNKRIWVRSIEPQKGVWSSWGAL